MAPSSSHSAPGPLPTRTRTKPLTLCHRPMGHLPVRLLDPTVRRARQKPVSRGNVGSACPRGHSSLHPVRTGVGVGGGGVGVCLLPWEVNSCFTHRGTFKSVLESSRTPRRYAGDGSKWQASHWLSSWSTSSLWSPELWHSDMPSETVSRPRRQVFCSARCPWRPGVPGGSASGPASAPGPVRFLAASLCCRNPVATRVPSSPSGTSVLRPFTWVTSFVHTPMKTPLNSRVTSYNFIVPQ